MTELLRGDIWLVDWSPGRGSEQAGLRPALIIQNDIGNQYSPTTIVAAISTTITKTYPPFTSRSYQMNLALKVPALLKLSK